MSQKACTLWTRVDDNIRKIVEELAKSQGLTISEYVRRLVIEDLDKRSIFTTILKQEVAARRRTH
ncbi:MAG: hypothetical protein QXZ25_06895 [Candidatus Bathyarchaeia archaeon]|nr:hypothetical protein [Candidatus Bathyarchaeota archaeon]